MRWPIQILSLNLTTRAEETNGQEWWAFSNLSISLTKTQVMNKRRQPSQQRIMNTVFSLALHTYFFNFSIRPVLFCLSCPEKGKCRCIQILWQLESDNQVKNQILLEALAFMADAGKDKSLTIMKFSCTRKMPVSNTDNWWGFNLVDLVIKFWKFESQASVFLF